MSARTNGVAHLPSPDVADPAPGISSSQPGASVAEGTRDRAHGSPPETAAVSGSSLPDTAGFLEAS